MHIKMSLSAKLVFTIFWSHRFQAFALVDERLKKTRHGITLVTDCASRGIVQCDSSAQCPFIHSPSPTWDNKTAQGTCCHAPSLPPVPYSTRVCTSGITNRHKVNTVAAQRWFECEQMNRKWVLQFNTFTRPLANKVWQLHMCSA